MNFVDWAANSSVLGVLIMGFSKQEREPLRSW